jgi:hypothetical protein
LWDSLLLSCLDRIGCQLRDPDAPEDDDDEKRAADPVPLISAPIFLDPRF